MSFPLSFLPPVIAHRGASTHAPENTMAAFRAAREQGALWIETDVKLTQDGVPILMHDETLERTTNGTGNIATKDWADIAALDAGSWFSSAFKGERIPPLTELVRFALDHHIQLNLELKPCPGRAQATALVTMIETAKLWPRTEAPPLISSFDLKALMDTAQIQPDWPRGLLLDIWRPDIPDLLRLIHARTLHIKEELLDDDRLAELRPLDIPLLAYTVNDGARARYLLQRGVKAVFSDNPASLLRGL